MSQKFFIPFPLKFVLAYAFEIKNMYIKNY